MNKAEKKREIRKALNLTYNSGFVIGVFGMFAISTLVKHTPSLEGYGLYMQLSFMVLSVAWTTIDYFKK